MSKRIALQLSEEASDRFDRLLKEANQGFEAGRILAADLINELILTTRIDLRALQLKHSDLRKSLKVMSAKENIDIDSAIRFLTELRGRATYKRRGNSIESEGVNP